MSREFRGLAVVVLALVVSAGARGVAQVTTADIEGLVGDESGGVLPGATITITNEETGLRRSTVSVESGRYRLQALPPGRYEIQAQLTGFRTEIRKGVMVQVARSLAVDFTLALATVEESVIVSGESALVETTRSSVGQVVDSSQVENLPLNGRSFQQLASLVPGARPGPPDPRRRGPFQEIAFGAQTGRMTNVTVDGGDISDIGVGWVTMGLPLDAIREFQVISNRFTAELGRSSTGSISVVTRSGTNELHGSAYGFFRDKALNWRNYFEKQRNLPKPEFNRRQYGGAVGGPLRRDRTHYFASYERTDENTFAVVNTLGLFPQFEGSVKTPYTLDLFTGRLDQQFSTAHGMFLRYGLHNASELRSVGGFSPREAGSTAFVKTHDAVVGHTWVLSSKSVNELRVHYGNFFGQQSPLSFTPRLSYFNLNLGEDPAGNPNGATNRRGQLRNDFSHFANGWHGEHNLKVGADVTLARVDAPFFANNGGVFTFRHNNYPFNAADPATWPFRYTLGTGDGYWRDNWLWFLGFYAQDDWKPRSNLTLNLGVRWEGETTASRPIVNTFTPFKERETAPDYNNWGPRLGFVWDPASTGRFVVRGGYGLFYFRAFTNATQNATMFDGRRYVTITVDNIPARADFVANPLGGRTPAEFISSNPFDTRLLSPDYVTPYTHQTSIGVSRQIGTDLSIDADYVNSLGRNEAVGRELNLLGVRAGQTSRDEFGLPVPRLYPQFRSVLQYETTGRSRYDGIHTSIRKRFSGSYQFGVSYTLSWAKGLLESGFGSLPNESTDREADYGFQRTDERHRVAVNGVIRLPGGAQVSPIVSFVTGRPYTLVRSGVDLNGDLRVNDREPGFARNSERMDSQFTFDVRVAKDIRLPRSIGVQLMFETFNVTNRANFFAYDGNTLNPQTLRQPTQAFDPRQMQLGVRLSF